MKLIVSAVAGAVAVVALGAGPSFATPNMIAAAKKAGMPATNCQYCHTTAAPKKDSWKPEELNDRGKFLLDDMKARNLKAPDAAKLKDYQEKK